VVHLIVSACEEKIGGKPCLGTLMLILKLRSPIYITYEIYEYIFTQFTLLIILLNECILAERMYTNVYLPSESRQHTWRECTVSCLCSMRSRGILSTGQAVFLPHYPAHPIFRYLFAYLAESCDKFRGVTLPPTVCVSSAGQRKKMLIFMNILLGVPNE